jgi:MFS family permease
MMVSERAPKVKSGAVASLIITAAAVLLSGYLVTTVIPALPRIQKEFSMTAETAAWITSGFLLVGAASATLLGRLGELYGKKRMFVAALALFTAGTALAGLAPTGTFLLLVLAVAGVGFGTFPLGLAMAADVFTKDRLATAQGVLAAAGGMSAAVGLVLGAYIVQDYGWREGLYGAAFASLVLLGMSAWRLKESAPRSRGRIDYLGAAFLFGGVALVLGGLTEGGSQGWLSLVSLGLLLPGGALLAGFFAWEDRASNPLIELRLLGIRNVWLANLVGVLAGLAYFLFFYAFVYYAELPPPSGLGLDVLATGLALVPAVLITLFVGPLMGWVATRAGPKPVIVCGALMLAVGFGAFGVYRTTSLQVTIDAIVAMAGAVTLMVPIVNMVSLSLPAECVPTGLGFNSTVRALGQATGPVIAATLMTMYTEPLTRLIQGRLVVVATVPSPTAFDVLFGIGILLAVVTVILGLLVHNYTFQPRTTSGEALTEVTERAVGK